MWIQQRQVLAGKLSGVVHGGAMAGMETSNPSEVVALLLQWYDNTPLMELLFDEPRLRYEVSRAEQYVQQMRMAGAPPPSMGGPALTSPMMPSRGGSGYPSAAPQRNVSGLRPVAQPNPAPLGLNVGTPAPPNGAISYSDFSPNSAPYPTDQLATAAPTLLDGASKDLNPEEFKFAGAANEILSMDAIGHRKRWLQTAAW